MSELVFHEIGMILVIILVTESWFGIIWMLLLDVGCWGGVTRWFSTTLSQKLRIEITLTEKALSGIIREWAIHDAISLIIKGSKVCKIDIFKIFWCHLASKFIVALIEQVGIRWKV